MPTYEYECLKNKHRFEEFQSMTAKPLTKCPVCKGKVKRLIGAGAGFLFKGSGFYTTDYRSSNYQDKKKSDAPAAESKGPTGDSAPAAPPAPKSDAAAKSKPPAATKSAAKGSAKKPKGG